MDNDEPDRAKMFSVLAGVLLIAFIAGIFLFIISRLRTRGSAIKNELLREEDAARRALATVAEAKPDPDLPLQKRIVDDEERRMNEKLKQENDDILMTVVIGGVAVLVTLVAVLVLLNSGESRRESALNSVGRSLDAIGIHSGRSPQRTRRARRLNRKYNGALEEDDFDNDERPVLSVPTSRRPRVRSYAANAMVNSRSRAVDDVKAIVDDVKAANEKEVDVSNYTALQAIGGAGDEDTMDAALVGEVAKMETEFLRKKRQLEVNGEFNRENAIRRARMKLRMPSNLNLEKRRNRVFDGFGEAPEEAPESRVGRVRKWLGR